jgi:hypothetical protein
MQMEVKNRKRIRIALCHLIFIALATLALTASAGAQIVVVGTGDPDSDVLAVQAAADQGGDIILKGHFSFDRPPTIHPSLPGFPLAMVQVSKAVAITGTQDEHGEMTSIEGGTIPFEFEAWGSRVTIQGLRFIRPKGAAIDVLAVSGLVIASCKIEGVEPVNHISYGIGIKTTFRPPTPAQPRHPEYVSGTLWVFDNDIDLAGGTALDNTLGVVIIQCGGIRRRGGGIHFWEHHKEQHGADNQHLPSRWTSIHRAERDNH